VSLEREGGCERGRPLLCGGRGRFSHYRPGPDVP